MQLKRKKSLFPYLLEGQQKVSWCLEDYGGLIREKETKKESMFKSEATVTPKVQSISL